MAVLLNLVFVRGKSYIYFIKEFRVLCFLHYELLDAVTNQLKNSSSL